VPVTGFARARDGRRLYYEVGGRDDGAPLLLIRGLGRSASYWLDFRRHLEEERRVVVFDNRGVGRSDTPDGWWSTADMADDTALVLRAAGVERADVFGISLGGMIAQQLALRHPHRVDRLVLACTTPGGEATVPISRPAALALARTARMTPRDAQATNARWVLSPEYLERHPEIVDVWAAIAEREPKSVRGLLGQILAGARHDAWRLLSHVPHETLVLTGDADRLISPVNSERIASRIPRARLDHLRGAGHDFPTERADETAERVLAFFS